MPETAAFPVTDNTEPIRAFPLTEISEPDAIGPPILIDDPKNVPSQTEHVCPSLERPEALNIPPAIIELDIEQAEETMTEFNAFHVYPVKIMSSFA
jgi:hypothetical protein